MSAPEGPPPITLRPMTPAEYPAWREHSTTAFAAELSQANGAPLEQAVARARQQYEDYLPDGLDTDGMLLRVVVDGRGQDVGVLWIGRHPQRAGMGFVWEIEIDEQHRGRGLGRATMLAAEEVAREQGWSAIALSVFGFNSTARRLYESLGYGTVAVQMVKHLPE